jgi:hypothetical protein
MAVAQFQQEGPVDALDHGDDTILSSELSDVPPDHDEAMDGYVHNADDMDLDNKAHDPGKITHLNLSVEALPAEVCKKQPSLLSLRALDHSNNWLLPGQRL